MIRRTFLILPTVGHRSERELWGHGVVDWDDFVTSPRLPGFSAARKGRLDKLLMDADEFLGRGETGYFHRLLPRGEHWRLYKDVCGDVAFLDIETDGLGPDAIVTVVGIHMRGRFTSLVRGIDLTPSNLVGGLRGCKMLVTFNGSSFDLPYLEREFPFAVPMVPHFDLRHGCARIGLRGGLKRIEANLGMCRPKELEYVTGERAVYLWHLWRRDGNRNALRLLREYNEEDVRNMGPVAEHVYEGLRRRAMELAADGVGRASPK